MRHHRHQLLLRKYLATSSRKKLERELKVVLEKCQLPPLHLEAAGCVAIDGKPTPACGGFIVNTSQRTHVNFCYNDNEFNLLYFRLRTIQGLPSSSTSSLLSVVCCVKSERENFKIQAAMYSSLRLLLIVAFSWLLDVFISQLSSDVEF